MHRFDIEAMCVAKQILTPGSVWTQGAFARGEHGETVPPFSERAVCWCLAGAIRKAYVIDEDRRTHLYATHLLMPYDVPYEIWATLNLGSLSYQFSHIPETQDGKIVVDTISPDTASKVAEEIVLWQDSPVRTKAQVLELLTTAIVYAERTSS